MNRYLLVFVYRNDRTQDCTNNGVTSPKHNFMFYVPHPEGPTIENDLEEHDVVLEPCYIGKSLYFKPRGIKGQCMAGGNFVYTSDSRFTTYNDCPVRVHDRVE